MRRTCRRGLTLVELMITVAMLGIMVAALGQVTRRVQLAGLAELQQERALLLLEYHADRLISDQSPDPQTLEQLTDTLPEADIQQTHAAKTTTLTVTWRDPVGGPGTRSLTVFSP